MSCSSCTGNMHGGCVEPGSPVAFDEPVKPHGTCDRYAARSAAAIELQMPPNRDNRQDGDMQRLRAQLGSINAEHARNVWDPRLTRSEGRTR